MPAAPEFISSRSNARVKQLRAALSDPPRHTSDPIALEGDHLVQEALRSGLHLRSVFLSERRDPPAWLPRSVDLVRLPAALFDSLSSTLAPQGIAALVDPPLLTPDDLFSATPLIVVAAALQDPGNLGTLIRSAEAFGASGVATTPGTVSPWNSKSLRGSAGSALRLPVVPIRNEDLLAWKARGITLLSTLPLAHGATPIFEADLTRPLALLIGNEGAGLAPDLQQVADLAVTIPCPGPVESLNAGVAASILLYEASRQRAANRPASKPSSREAQPA